MVYLQLGWCTTGWNGARQDKTFHSSLSYPIPACLIPFQPVLSQAGMGQEWKDRARGHPAKWRTPSLVRVLSYMAVCGALHPTLGQSKTGKPHSSGFWAHAARLLSIGAMAFACTAVLRMHARLFAGLAGQKPHALLCDYYVITM